MYAFLIITTMALLVVFGVDVAHKRRDFLQEQEEQSSHNS